MLGAGRNELTNLNFVPEETVHFNLEANRQCVPVEVSNNEAVDVIVKWKSTSPSKFYVEPNFFIVKANSTKMFQCMVRGSKKEFSLPGERFTLEISAIQPTEIDAREIWGSRTHQEELFIGKRHKKEFCVEYRSQMKNPTRKNRRASEMVKLLAPIQED